MLYKAVFVDRDCGYYNVGTGVGTSLIDQIKGMIEVFSNSNHKSEIINVLSESSQNEAFWLYF